MEKRKEIFNFLEKMENSYGKFPKMAHGIIDTEEKIHYAGPFFDNNELVAAIEALLFSSWHSAGNICLEFEKEFSKSVNNSFGCFLNSGSSANLILIAALKEYFNWQDKNEIIVSPCGFPTTISPIIQNNLIPIFIDISFDDLNFNLSLIEKKITKQTKAIFLSPVLGSPPDIHKLLNICEKNNLKLILDCCDSLWTEFNNKQLTEYAIASTHSFFPAHIITTLEGGIITSNNKEIIKISKSLISWGRACFCSGSQNYSQNGACNKRFNKWLSNLNTIIDHRYLFDRMGYNLKNLELCAAIGLEQLKKKEEIIKKRKENLIKIQELFKHLEVIFPKVHKLTNWVPFAVPIICYNKEYKLKLVQHLEKNKIQTRNYFAGNLLLHKGFQNIDNYKKYPESNKVLDLVFFVGCAPHINDKHIDYFSRILGEFK